jgi:hypothetical protein
MGFTASTNSLKQSTLTFTGNIGRSGAKKFVYFVQYTKGDETAATLSISFIKKSISATTTFNSSPVDTATVAQQVFTITGTQNVAIPVTVHECADSIVAVLASTGSTATGTIVVDGFPDLTTA